MLALLALTAALAAPGLSLPPGAPPGDWDSVARLAGFEVVVEGADVRVSPVEGGWEVRATGADGRERAAVVPAPTTRPEREELAWLAASLLSEVSAPPPPAPPTEPAPKQRRRLFRRARAAPRPPPPPPATPEPAAPRDPDIARATEFARGLPDRLEPVVVIDDPPEVRDRTPRAWLQGGMGALARPQLAEDLGTSPAMALTAAAGVWVGEVEVGLGLRAATRRQVRDLPRDRGLRSLGLDLLAGWTPGPALLTVGLGLEVQDWLQGPWHLDPALSPQLLVGAGLELPLTGGLTLVPLIHGRAEVGSTRLFVGEERVGTLSPWQVEARLDLRWRKR